MRMAVRRVVDVRVDASFENLLEEAGFCQAAVGRLSDLDVGKGWNMSQIENAGIAKFDRFLQQFFLRNHLPGDDVPYLPKLTPPKVGQESQPSLVYQ